MKRNILLATVEFRLYLLVFLFASLFTPAPAGPVPAEEIMPAGNPAGGSTAAQAVVIYAEGNGFELVRNHRVRSIDLYTENIIGMEMYNGDLINTDRGTLVELQLYPSSNILKISENTSFSLSSVHSDGAGGEFQVTYGRVRARVSKIVANETFAMRGPSMVAGVRGTDFGYDVMALENEAGGPVSRVYCFEGEVEVSLSPGSDAPDTPDSVIITENEMVTLEYTDPDDPGMRQAVLNIAPMDREIYSYWNIHDFRGELFPVSHDIPAPAEAADIDTPEPPSLRREQLVRGGLIAGGIGIALEAAAILMIYQPFSSSGTESAGLRSAGAGVAVSGGFFLTTSLLSFIMAAFH